MAAKFPRLTQFLESTGEVSPQVDRLMIAKIGCAGFLPSKQPESASAFPISEREEQQNRLSTPGGSIVAMHGSTFPGIYPEIIKALEKHQNVFDLSV